MLGVHVRWSAGSARHAAWTSWQWPYVDVSFYDENATHVWDAAPEFHGYVYRKSIVFPTHLRPFAGLWLPAPRDTLAYLATTYPRRRHCTASPYSHKVERPAAQRALSMRCRRLKDVYSFVHRRPAGVGRRQRVAPSPGIVEVLMLGDVVLHSAHVEEPAYTVHSDPYVLPTRRSLASLTAD